MEKRITIRDKCIRCEYQNTPMESSMSECPLCLYPRPVEVSIEKGMSWMNLAIDPAFAWFDFPFKRSRKYYLKWQDGRRMEVGEKRANMVKEYEK